MFSTRMRRKAWLVVHQRTLSVGVIQWLIFIYPHSTIRLLGSHTSTLIQIHITFNLCCVGIEGPIVDQQGFFGCWLLLVSMHGIIIIINNNNNIIKGIGPATTETEHKKALTHYLSSFDFLSHINSHPDPHHLHLMLWELKVPLWTSRLRRRGLGLALLCYSILPGLGVSIFTNIYCCLLKGTKVQGVSRSSVDILHLLLGHFNTSCALLQQLLRPAFLAAYCNIHQLAHALYLCNSS